MKKLTLSCSLGTSAIFFGELEDCWSRIESAAEAPLVTDNRVASFYPQLFRGRAHCVLPAGEKMKSLATAKKFYRQFLDWKLDRSSMVIGLGGGALCDLVGFAASTYLRGINFLLVPTSLLAQVDAAVGGKTGINFAGLKNVIGTFALPRATLIDVRFLLTLPREEILGGLAEVIKHGLIASSELFSLVEKNWESILQKELELLEKIVFSSVQVKMTVVSEDVQEADTRRILNFGHTFAHALEKTRRISHGLAVAWGMAFATRLSAHLGLLDQGEAQCILTFLHRVYPFLERMEFSSSFLEKLFEKIQSDKKKTGDDISLVLLRRIGEAQVRRIPLKELRGVLRDLCQSGKH